MNAAPGGYLYDTPADRHWRRYGHWAYLAACLVIVALVPVDASAPARVVDLLSMLPALRGLFAVSSADARIAAWVIGSLMAYPLMHMGMRSRIYRAPRGPYWKLVLAVVVLDAVLLGALSVDLMSLEGNRSAKILRLAMSSDGAGFLVATPLLSLVYGGVAFFNLFLLELTTSRIARR